MRIVPADVDDRPISSTPAAILRAKPATTGSNAEVPFVEGYLVISRIPGSQKLSLGA
jgi:hypothetical protein